MISTILYDFEKEGGTSKSLTHMDAFREALFENDLKDIGVDGPVFTWTNKRKDPYHIKERLNRFVANHIWLNDYQFFKSTYLDFYGFDHRPILLHTEYKNAPKVLGNRRRFMFENKWFMKEDFDNFVENTWTQFPQENNLFNKLDRMLIAWISGQKRNLERTREK